MSWCHKTGFCNRQDEVLCQTGFRNAGTSRSVLGFLVERESSLLRCTKGSFSMSSFDVIRRDGLPVYFALRSALAALPRQRAIMCALIAQLRETVRRTVIYTLRLLIGRRKRLGQLPG